MRQVGSRVREQREALAYSQNNVANMTGLSINTVSSLENGKGATLDNFLLICRAIKMQPQDVFNAEYDMTPLYNLPPGSKRRIEVTQKLDNLVYNTDFFDSPKRVSEVLEELDSNKGESNKFSVYLTGYCKEGELAYIKEGNVKKYLKKK